MVVAAATNYGRNPAGGVPTYGTIGAPGNDPYVITVGATNTHGAVNLGGNTIASFNSNGPTAIDHLVKPDLVAPGNSVVSLMAPNNTLAATEPSTLVANSYYQSGNPAGTSTKYFSLSGTSMATPVVSGAAALLIQKNPSLTPDQVKARLMKTAYKVFPQYSSALASATQRAFVEDQDIDGRQSLHARLLQGATRWETRRYLLAAWRQRRRDARGIRHGRRDRPSPATCRRRLSPHGLAHSRRLEGSSPSSTIESSRGAAAR